MMTAGLLLSLACSALAGSVLPMTTESAEASRKGDLTLESYLDAEQTPHVRYHSPEGMLITGPVIGLRYGLAETVEFKLSGPVQVWAYPDTGGDRSEIGDFTVWTKWAAAKEREKRPAMGLRWGVKLPNASDQSDLGTDEVDFHFQGLGTKKLGRWRLDGNMGLGILGDPTQYSLQNDVLTFGFAATLRLSPDWSAMNELQGATGKGYLPGYTMMRWGAAWEPGGGPWRYFGAVTRGVTARSPDWGIRLGLSRTLSFGASD